MEDKSIAKKGYLQGFLRSYGSNRKWKERYYVLFHSSPQCQPRLDYYPDENSFLHDKTVRKTIYIEEIKSVERHQEEGFPHCLFITTESQKDHILSTSSKSEATEWLSAINDIRERLGRVSGDMMNLHMDDDDDEWIDDNICYESLTKCASYNIVVQQTEAADRCNISEKPFNLVITKQYMALISKDDAATMFSWQYSHIRRYGRNKQTFLFEAGRKCLSGPGMFILKTSEGQRIFQEIRGLTRNLHNDKAKSDNSSREGAGVKQKSVDEPMYQEPEVPKRGYKSIDRKQPQPPPQPAVPPPGPHHKLNIPTKQPSPKPFPKVKPTPNPDFATLGKVSLVDNHPTDAYTSVYEAKRLDPEYGTAPKMAAGKKGGWGEKPNTPEPEYAVYDISASSRFSGGPGMNNLNNPGSKNLNLKMPGNPGGHPGLHTPGSTTPGSASSLAAVLRGNRRLPNTPIAPPEEEYAHLNITATPFEVTRRRPETPTDNQYELAGSFQEGPQRNGSTEHLYDEVGKRG